MKPRAVLEQRKVFKGQPDGRLAHIRLDYNENLVGPGPKVVAAIARMIASEYAAYPEYEAFHEELARFVGAKPEEVLSTNGSDEAIRLILEAYVEPGEEVLLLEPSFEMFQIHAEAVGAEIRKVLYEGRDFSFPQRALMDAVSPKTKMVLIANPNNPTGSWAPTQVLEELVKAAPHALFLLDEAYEIFAKESALPLFKKYPNVAITQTFSKGYGLAALRIGYVVAQKELIDALKKVQLPSSVNKMALIAASAAMAHPEYARAYAQEIIKNRQQVKESLEELGFHAAPSQGNFLLVNFGSHYAAVKEKLKQAHILVRDRGEETLLKNSLRIAIGPKKHMEYLINRIRG